MKSTKTYYSMQNIVAELENFNEGEICEALAKHGYYTETKTGMNSFSYTLTALGRKHIITVEHPRKGSSAHGFMAISHKAMKRIRKYFKD